MNVNGCDIDDSVVTYTGDGTLKGAVNLVVYQNIFQDNKFFAREYEDISSTLSEEKQNEFHQTIKVQPLSIDEINVVTSDDFIADKKEKEKVKYKKM